LTQEQKFKDDLAYFAISFSILHIAKPFNLFCNIVVLKQFLSSFNFEKLLSADATVTGTVKRIRYAIETFESSCFLFFSFPSTKT